MDSEVTGSSPTSQDSQSSRAFISAATTSQTSTIMITPPNMEVEQVTSPPQQQHYPHPSINAVPNKKNFIRKRPGWRPALKIIRPTVPTTTTTTPIKRRTRKLSSTSSSSSSPSPSISSRTSTPTEPSSLKPPKPKIKPDAPKTKIKQKASKTKIKQKAPQAKRKRKRKGPLNGRRIIINYKPPILRGPTTSDVILLGSSSEDPASPEISVVMTLEPRFPKFGTKQTSLLNFFKKL